MKFKVEGMTCDHCVRAISRAVEPLGGRAQVDLDAGTVSVDGTADVPAVRQAIEGEGYTVSEVLGDPAVAPEDSPASTGCCGSCHT